ncbi:MAG TPA: maltose alpha-D-glucosyltransferase [Anaerolineae bacterium]
MSQAAWYQDAVFYELYPRAFFDSNGDGHGDLNGVTAKLDYLQELGVTCLWLLPIFESPLVDDGYDVSDYRRIQARYGSVADLSRLIREAHRRELRVIADVVMNHTSDQHPWFIDSRASKHSPRRDYYLWSASETKFREARIIFIDHQKSNWQFDATTGEYYFHRFYAEQPDLNYDHPDVRQAMFDIMKFWLDLGLDGFRCDAVPYLFKREGTNCENLPETHAYLKSIRRWLDENYPDKLLLAEANQLPAEVRDYLGEGDEFHMAFHFPLMPQIFIALKQQEARPIVDVIRKTPPIPPSTQWCIFLRNHDELTLEMVTPDERDWLWKEYAPEPRMRLNLGIRRRLAPLLDNQRSRLELAHSLLLTLPGSPIIYYGDEIGMGDNIQLKDRDGVRTPMQWSADTNAGFSNADKTQLYAPVIDDAVFGYRVVNVEAQRADPDSLLNVVTRLIRARRQFPAFSRGELEFLLPDAGPVLAYVRAFEFETMLVVNNLSTAAQTISFNLARWAGKTPREILSRELFPPISTAPYTLSLAPHQYLWLEIS